MDIIYGFLSIFIIGCLSLIGLFLVSLKEKTLDGILFVLVAFATGTIFASALFDLIPESIHHLEEVNISGNYIYGFIILGYVVFFIMERFIYWFHGHAHQKEDQFVCYDNLTENIDETVKQRGKVRNFVLLNLVGDGLHNFLDGVIIMVAFLTGIGNGIVISLAVLFHELPQEIGDFGILLYGGFSKKKALGFNFLSAMVAMLGGVFAFILSGTLELFNLFFLAFSGGGFIYLASTELMPELLKQKKLKRSIVQSIVFICGILLIIILVLVLPHE
jgi:zinc and cadmium transporter